MNFSNQLPKHYVLLGSFLLSVPCFGSTADESNDQAASGTSVQVSDQGRISANVTNSACIRGTANARVTETGGGGVNLPDLGTTVPPTPMSRNISGSDESVLREGAGFNIPIRPGQEYSVDWTANGPMTSAHTRVHPQSAPSFYQVQMNSGDGNGWQSTSSNDVGGPGNITPTAIDMTFRIVRPIRPAGKSGEIIITDASFRDRRINPGGGQSVVGVFGIDEKGALDNNGNVVGDGLLDLNVPAARMLVSMGAALEDGKEVSAGDIIFNMPLWKMSGVDVNTSFLSYEGIDTSSTNVDVVTDSNGFPRQVSAPDLFLDIVTISGNSKFELRLYGAEAVSGQNSTPYVPTGSPYAKCVFEKIGSSGGFPAGLRVTEFENGLQTSTVDLAARKPGLSENFDTRVKRGDEVTLTENRVIIFPNGGSIDVAGQTFLLGALNGSSQGREKTVEIERDGVLVNRRIERYAFGNNGKGEGILDRKNFHGSGNNDYLLTQYWHHWLLQSTNADSLGSPILRYNPDGSWERMTYDSNGALEKIYRPYKGVPTNPWLADDTNSMVETLSYGTDPYRSAPTGAPQGIVDTLANLLTKRVVTINGVTVSSETVDYSAELVGGQPVLRTTEKEFSDATNFVQTITDVYHDTAPGFLRGRLSSVTTSFGEKTSYTYERGTFNTTTRGFTVDSDGEYLREFQTQGTTASPNGIQLDGKSRTERKILVRDTHDKIHQEIVQIYTGGATYEQASVKNFFFDEFERLTETRQDGRVLESIAYNGMIRTETSADGVARVITEDANGRVASNEKADGPAFSMTYNGLTESKTLGSLSSSVTKDLAGRYDSVTDSQGRVLSYEYPNEGRDVLTTYPGDQEVLYTYHPGGNLIQSITNTDGNSVVPRYFEHDYELVSGRQWTRERIATASSSRTNKVTRDWLNREVLTEVPSPDGTGFLTKTTNYGSHGSKSKESYSTNAALAPRIFEYDSFGKIQRTGLDRGGAVDQLDDASLDQIVEFDYYYEKIEGFWYRVRTVKEFPDNNSTAEIIIETNKVRMHASGAGLASHVISINPEGVETEVSEVIDRADKKVTVTTTTDDREMSGLQVYENGLLDSQETSEDSAASTYDYDSLERFEGITDARTGLITTFKYNAQGLLESLENGLNEETKYFYYPSSHANAGLLKERRNPDLTRTYYAYNDRGQRTQTWGSASHPTQEVYDSYGQRKTLSTYRAGSGWNSSTWPTSTVGVADTTTWEYNAATGLLEDKEDALGRKTRYTWRANGQLHTREWEREALTTTYGYDDAGLETSRTYSDGTTPNVSFTRSRNGQVTEVTDAAGVSTISYHDLGNPELISIAGAGILSGHSTSYGTDDSGRTDLLEVKNGATTRYSASIDYDLVTGRMDQVTQGGHTAKYYYHPNSNLVKQVSFSTGGEIIMANATGYDALDRVSSTQAMVKKEGAMTPVSFYGYQYNSMGRRDLVSLLDGTTWDLEYTDRGEIEGVDRKAGNQFLAGQQFHYSYDNAGNRVAKMTGGNSVGAGRRAFSSTPNALNQYASYNVPATTDIVGRSGSTVTVNGSGATKQGDWFRSEITSSNSPNGDWLTVSISSDGETKTGNLYVPPSSTTPAYDEDGNLTNDGEWIYGYDAENRLISATRSPLALSAGAPYRKLVYAYDYQHRRIQRLCYHAPGAPPAITEKYLYTGNQRVLTVDATNQPVQSFTWGLDISNTPTGAGGAGGLLWVHDHQASQTHLASHDGNGNVVSLVASDTKEVSATYEYTPFGELHRSTGSYADKNPFRFSTQAQDFETGLIYYGYRSLKPSWGVWTNRDPLGERGGNNLYLLLANDPMNTTDYRGLLTWREWAQVGLNTLSYMGTSEYWNEVGNNYKQIGKGIKNGAEAAVDGIKSLPELADFIASGEAAEMVDRLLNDPDYRDEFVKRMGSEGCRFLAKLQTNDGAFEATGELLFSVASGAALLKAVKIAKKLKNFVPKKSKPSQTTFRGDNRPPEEIFEKGFETRGDSDDLLAHAHDHLDPPSNFISTSKSPDVASKFGDNVFVIESRNGIDVNKVLGGRSPFRDELEVAIPGGVKPNQIRGVTIPSQKVSHINPNFGG